MSAKRHHYLPTFLIRRFAQRKDPPFVYRLDVSSGRTRLVPPRSQAFRHQYYRFDLEGEPIELDGEPVDPGIVEKDLQRIDGDAANAIRRLVSGVEIEPRERFALAIFCAVQERRTPQGRAEARFMDEFLHTLEQEMWFSNKGDFLAHARTAVPEISEEEIENFRVDTLEQIQSGKLVFKAPRARELALIFFQLDEVVLKVLKECEWWIMRVDEDAPDLVLSDVGITQVDHTPRHPKAGRGWMSSPGAETILPIDPRMAVVVTPGSGDWFWGDIDADEVEDINLRSYAHSDVCYYGTSQESVCELRRLARRESVQIGEYAPRSPVLWVAETEGPSSGEMDFTGYSVRGTTKARFIVDPDATKE